MPNNNNNKKEGKRATRLCTEKILAKQVMGFSDGNLELSEATRPPFSMLNFIFFLSCALSQSLILTSYIRDREWGR